MKASKLLRNTCTHTTILWPLHRSTYVSWLPQLRKWKILLEQSFTDHMLLLKATSTFGLERRCWNSLQWCYLHHLHINRKYLHFNFGHIKFKN